MSKKKEKEILKSFRLDAKLVKLFLATADVRKERYKHIIERFMNAYIKEQA